MQTAVSLLTVAMVAWVPPVSQASRSGEPEGAAADRYAAIARDVARVACADANEPPVYPEPNARWRTAVWLVAQAKCESMFDRDVDRGACRKGTCDHGHAWGLWQIHTDAGLTYEGLRFLRFDSRPKGWVGTVWDGPALTADRSQGARMALHVRRVSKRLWTTWECAETLERAWNRTHEPAWCSP